MAKQKDFSHITRGNKRPTFFDNKPKKTSYKKPTLPIGKVNIEDIVSGKVSLDLLEKAVKKEWKAKPVAPIRNQSGNVMTRQQFLNLPKNTQQMLGRTALKSQAQNIYAAQQIFEDITKNAAKAGRGKYKIP